MTKPQFNLNYSYGADLREIPEDRASMQAYVDHILRELKKIQIDQPRLMVKILGDVGTYARILGKPQVALQCLNRSLDTINEKQLGLALWAVHSLRFGEVLRVEKDDLGAETAFRSVLEMCRRHPEIAELEDFGLQHMGKLRFTQNNLKEAEENFRLALMLRQRKGVRELIASTEFALKTTLMIKDRNR